MSYSEEIIQTVWEKGSVVPNADPNIWRKDAVQAWIRREDYGNRDTIYGWEIDHITRTKDGGTDNLSNLRPLQWQNNLAREDNPFAIAVTSSGDKNVLVE